MRALALLPLLLASTAFAADRQSFSCAIAPYGDEFYLNDARAFARYDFVTEGTTLKSFDVRSKLVITLRDGGVLREMSCIYSSGGTSAPASFSCAAEATKTSDEGGGASIRNVNCDISRLARPLEGGADHLAQCADIHVDPARPWARAGVYVHGLKCEPYKESWGEG